MFHRYQEGPVMTVAVPKPAPDEVAAHRAMAAGYKTSAPEIRANMLALVDQFAALVDDAMALTDAAAALDERSTVLAAEARGRGQGDPAMPAALEEMVHALRGLDPEYGVQMARLWTSTRRGRRAVGDALHGLFDAVERRRR